jgi:hypothetical protein
MLMRAGSTPPDPAPGGGVPSHVRELQVSLVLRLVLDERGRVLHGQVIDVADRTSTYFRARRGLAHAVGRLLARYRVKKPEH